MYTLSHHTHTHTISKYTLNMRSLGSTYIRTIRHIISNGILHIWGLQHVRCMPHVQYYEFTDTGVLGMLPGLSSGDRAQRSNQTS